MENQKITKTLNQLIEAVINLDALEPKTEAVITKLFEVLEISNKQNEKAIEIIETQDRNWEEALDTLTKTMVASLEKMEEEVIKSQLKEEFARSILVTYMAKEDEKEVTATSTTPTTPIEAPNCNIKITGIDLIREVQLVVNENDCYKVRISKGGNITGIYEMDSDDMYIKLDTVSVKKTFDITRAELFAIMDGVK